MKYAKQKRIWPMALVIALVLVIAPLGAMAQEGPPPITVEVEVTQVEAGRILTGTADVPYAITDDTVVIGPQDNSRPLHSYKTPFPAIITYSPPIDGAEGTVPTLIQVQVLEDIPR